MNRHTFVFIGGLHRSGTSLLHACLRDHPRISGFRDTGVPEDEGQHLQSVYPAAKVFGGPGRFGFHRDAYLDNASPLATRENAERLFREWARHWDLEKPVLLEKSPPNLIRGRFLQALFPDSHFIAVTRHPVAVSFATQKWSRTSLASLIRHWLVCHERFENERSRLKNVLVVRYERFVAAPQASLDEIYATLGVETSPATQDIRADVNGRYFSAWDAMGGSLRGRVVRRTLCALFENRVNRFGYSLDDLRRSVSSDRFGRAADIDKRRGL